MNEDLEYIKKFAKINIAKACRKAGVKKQNVWTGKTSKENMKKVRRILESNVAELYIIKGEENEQENSTL